MEVSTKERLTGALIVVLALVVVAPELLSGRHAPESGTPAAQDPEDGAPLQTISIQLDSPAAPSAIVRDVPEEPEAVPTEPVPVAAESPPAAPAAAVASQVVPETKPPVQEAVAPKPAVPATRAPAAAATGKWWVQVGSFSSRDNAERLARQLRADGFATDLAQGSSNGKPVFRVRAGPAADRAAAEALRSRLIKAGHKNPSLVAP